MNLLHKICGTTKQSDLQPKEIFSYSLAGLGQNMVSSIVTSFIIIYFTDALLFPARWVAWLVLVNRILDGLNDPVMGSIVDHTRTRWGKLRPYLLFTPFFLGIVTVLCFTTIKTGSESLRFAWSAAIYILWVMVYTIQDVPYWGLSSAMTSDTVKRNNMITIARMFCMLGAGIITVFVPMIQGKVELGATGGVPLAQLSEAAQAGFRQPIAHGLQSMFLIAAIVVSVFAVPMFWVGFKNTKERFYEGGKPGSFLHNIGLLFQNKPLLLILLSGVLGSLRTSFLVTATYFAKYNLGNTGASAVITMLVVPGGLAASLLTPYLSKKYGKRDLMIYSHLIASVVMFAVYFAGARTGLAYGERSAFGLAFCVTGMVLAGIPSGFSNILSYSMIADTIDYLEYKTGERGEGICFAMQTFINSVNLALSAFAMLLTLALNNFDEYSNMAAPHAVKSGIWLISTLAAGVSMLLFALPLFFYRFTEQEQAKAAAATAKRKNRALV